MRKYLFLLTLCFNIALSEELPKPLLVGLSVNGKETHNIDALKTDKSYALPYTLLIQTIGIQPTEQGNDLLFDTPIGKSQLHRQQLVHYRGKDYIALSDLKALGITAKFQPSDYTIALHFPWNKNPPNKKASKGKRKQANIDYYPDLFGVNELSINGEWSQKKDNNNTSNQQQIHIGSSGNLAGGVWGAKMIYEKNSDNSSQANIDNIYWTATSKHSAIRAGINQPSYDVGNNNEFTGVSAAYSNQVIERHIESGNSHTKQLLQNTYQDYRTISGEGPAGGIAELRINGRAIARVRIALDKRYEFKNLDLNQLHNNEHHIEIALYEYQLAGKPMKIIPYRLGKRQSNVATGELLVEMGIGRLGNQLDKATYNTISDNNKTYGYTYSEYGLTNDIALRFATNRSNHWATMAGANIGLSQSLNWDIVAWKYHNEKRYRSELAYEQEKLTLNYHYDYSKSDSGVKEQKHSLSSYFRPNDNLNFSLNAYHNKYNHRADEDYFTTSVFAQLTPNLNAQLNRGRYNDYSYRINWDVPAWQSDFSVTGDEDKNSLSAHYRMNEASDIGLDLTKYHHRSPLFSRLYATHQFNENNRLYAAYSHYRSQSGWQVDWRHQVNNGLNLHLGYRKNNLTADNEYLDNETTSIDRYNAYLGFEMHLSNTPSGLYFSPYKYHSNGRILANISADDIPLTDDNIVLQLDHQRVKAKKLDEGKYLINHIKPGIYQLRLDDKNLPIEYSTNNLLQPIVKVENAATTVVPYHLRKRLGISGKVENTANNTSDKVLIEVYQDDKKITQTWANRFGYYQITGLKPATYQIKARGYQTTTVALNKAYLFEVNLRRRQ